jgi:peroxin-6
MEHVAHVPDHPKKRRRKPVNRRRLRSKDPISARLVLDHQLRGDIGVLSDDLVADLFPSLSLEGEVFRDFPIALLRPCISLSNVVTVYAQVRPRKLPRDTTCCFIAMVVA